MGLLFTRGEVSSLSYPRRNLLVTRLLSSSVDSSWAISPVAPCRPRNVVGCALLCPKLLPRCLFFQLKKSRMPEKKSPIPLTRLPNQPGDDACASGEALATGAALAWGWLVAVAVGLGGGVEVGFGVGVGVARAR